MSKPDLKPSAPCPDCGSQSLYRTGFSTDGALQRYLCRDCGRSFQTAYLLSGFDPAVRAEALAMYLAGSTQTAINQKLKISFGAIRTLIKGHRRGRVLPSCPRCGDSDTCKFGKADDRVTQRYRCKSCGKTFTAETDSSGAQGQDDPDTRNLKS